MEETQEDKDLFGVFDLGFWFFVIGDYCFNGAQVMCLVVRTSEKYFSDFLHRKLSVEVTGKFVSFVLKKKNREKFRFSFATIV